MVHPDASHGPRLKTHMHKAAIKNILGEMEMCEYRMCTTWDRGPLKWKSGNQQLKKKGKLQNSLCKMTAISRGKKYVCTFMPRKSMEEYALW